MKLKDPFLRKERSKVTLNNHFTFTFIFNKTTTLHERVLTELQGAIILHCYLRNLLSYGYSSSADIAENYVK